jgi:hypothetical protein
MTTCALEGHAFWGDEISFRDLVPAGAVLTHAHITDVYLLGLALHREARLATLDRRLPDHILPGGNTALEIVPA